MTRLEALEAVAKAAHKLLRFKTPRLRGACLVELEDALKALAVVDLERLDRQAKTQCPHGADLGDCPMCDYDGDLAFDAAREDQYR